MTTLNRDYVTTVHFTYPSGEEFLLTDTLHNMFLLFQYQKPRLFGASIRKVLMEGNHPVSVNSDMRDLRLMLLQEVTYPEGTVGYNISKETHTNALIGIIPSGDRNALQQQLIDWENERGWKRKETGT